MQSSFAPVPTSDIRLPPEIQALFLAHGRSLRARRGHIVIAAGFHASDVFVVIEGRVQVALVTPQGRETIIREIGPGQLFGELAAIDGELRSANVTAIEDSRLVVLGGARFVELIETDSALALWIARHLTTQVRFLTARLYELATMSAGARLHCELMRLCIEHGIADGRSVIENAPTHAELAARIGTNRETVTREFGQLVDEGILHQAGRRLHILSLDKLGTLIRRFSANG